MPKKKKHRQPTEPTPERDYYQLHTDAIDRLVNAEEGEVPEVGQEEIEKYQSGFLSKIPTWIKALFIKFWFAGAVCFFFYLGLGTYITNYWDQILVLGLAMGVVTDLLVNNLFRFMAAEEHYNDKWMLFPQKKFYTLFANIGYAYFITACVIAAYTGINVLLGSQEGEVPKLLVEPFLFGFLYLAFDMAVIGIRNLIWSKVKQAKSNKSAAALEPQEVSPAHSPVGSSAEPPTTALSQANSDSSADTSNDSTATGSDSSADSSAN